MSKRMTLIVGLITAACNPGTNADSATLGGAGTTESSGVASVTDAVPTSGMSASDSNTEGPGGSASNSESDSNVTANNSESLGDPSASDSASASASDGSAGTTGSVDDTAAGSSDDASTDGASTGGASTAGGTDPSAGGEGSASDTDPVECTPRICEADGQIHGCGDCIDNDGDNQTDCTDLDCFGPCDDDEDVLGSQLEDKDPCKQDCYFDGDGGQGGGDCQWNMKCDPLEPGGPVCGYNPDLDPDDPDDASPELGKCVDGEPSDCTDHCAPPKGCDCFGCCTIDGVDRFIGSPGCTLEDPDGCLECTKQDWCESACNDGDLCFPDIEPSQC